jgi:hypothetical protein
LDEWEEETYSIGERKAEASEDAESEDSVDHEEDLDSEVDLDNVQFLVQKDSESLLHHDLFPSDPLLDDFFPSHATFDPFTSLKRKRDDL